ncbi:MAG: 50S ribosomal protein L3 [Candidatus Zixiibacteriota bacterium]
MHTLLGKKIGMTRLFMEDGTAVPVTVVEAGPCSVVAIMTKEKNGYNAFQIGFGTGRKDLFNKPRTGQFKTAGIDPTRYLREVRVPELGETKVGDSFKVDDIFHEGEKVDITGTSRGMGFAGVMKRHHFSGSQKTHGQSDRMRAPGSIGQSSYPSRVLKGIRMAGRMGGETVTVAALRVVKVIPEENLILIKGGIPGKANSLLKIRKSTRK